MVSDRIPEAVLETSAEINITCPQLALSRFAKRGKTYPVPVFPSQTNRFQSAGAPVDKPAGHCFGFLSHQNGSCLVIIFCSPLTGFETIWILSLAEGGLSLEEVYSASEYAPLPKWPFILK